MINFLTRPHSFLKTPLARNFSVISKDKPQTGAYQGRITDKYTIIDHTYDAIVVGAGGAG